MSQATDFIEKNKNTKKIISTHYESGIYDHFITAYPKGITNPHVVEFKETSVVNWKRQRELFDKIIVY